MPQFSFFTQIAKSTSPIRSPAAPRPVITSPIRLRERWTVFSSAENERPVSMTPTSAKNRRIWASMRLLPSAMMTTHDLVAVWGRETLGADAHKQRREAVSEEFERLVVERDADDVLEPALDRGGACGGDGLTVNPRFLRVEDTAANIGRRSRFCSAAGWAEPQGRPPRLSRRESGRRERLPCRMRNDRLLDRRRGDNLGHERYSPFLDGGLLRRWQISSPGKRSEISPKAC